MATEIVNLRTARKRRQRAEKDEQAAQNRIDFGRTKTERSLTEARNALDRRKLDQKKLEAAKPVAED